MNLPQAAQLPQPSGSVEKKRPTVAAKGAECVLGGQDGGTPRNAGVLGSQPPRKQGGAGGRSPPRPLVSLGAWFRPQNK